MRDDGADAAARGAWVRSKWGFLLLVLGLMVLLFAAGVVWRIVSPTEEDRVVRDLPVYPGSRAAGFPASDPGEWRRYGTGFSRAIVLSYVLPRGSSRDEVLRYYGTHMPRSFRREGSSCWARGDARVLLVVAAAAQPKLDVAVATDGAECAGT